MYNFFISIVFGFVQGIAEFLPISSSAHLLLLHEIFDVVQDSLSFDAALHLGTLLAIMIYFAKDIRSIIIAFFRSLTKKRTGEAYERLSWFILLGSIPAVCVGVLFETIIEDVFRSTNVVVVTLIIGGLLFFIVEKFGKKIQGIKEMTWVHALVIGVAQAFALIPGVSRSGITITAGMALRMTRYEAARFSFLLAIPVIFGAGMKKMYDALSSGISDGGLFIAGIVSSFIFGLIAIKFLLAFTQKYSLNAFGIYRIILALVVLFATIII